MCFLAFYFGKKNDIYIYLDLNLHIYGLFRPKCTFIMHSGIFVNKWTYLNKIFNLVNDDITSVLQCVERPTPSSHSSSIGLCWNFRSTEKWKKEGCPCLILSVKRFTKPKNWNFQQQISKPRSGKIEVSLCNPSGFKTIYEEE